METTLTERLKRDGFTITGTGGGCSAWVKHFDVEKWPPVEGFCHPFVMVSQDSSHEVDDLSVDEYGLYMQYNEYSADENEHFYTDVEFSSAEELHHFLFWYVRNTVVAEFPDFDNWLGFGVALNQLEKHGFENDVSHNNAMPSIAFNSTLEGHEFTQLRVWFNWYNLDLSEQAGKLYAVTQYDLNGNVVAEHEFDNVEQLLRVARALQIMANPE